MTDAPKHRAGAQSVWARFWRWLTSVEHHSYALLDEYGDGYGIYATRQDAEREGQRLSLGAFTVEPSSAPVNNGNDPQNELDQAALRKESE